MDAALVLGAVLSLVGLVLLANLFGAGDFVIARVTSRSLGALAPGFAATAWGFRAYATLVLALGLVCLGFWAATWSGRQAATLVVAGAALFVIASVVAIAGEVVVYRRLKS
ncbi:MAG TPA: hypothetical protein VEW68_01975 [Patescibacteria group bacterium]|nr:hypothetical protein [Patescibacteria group bacterium]